MGREELGLVQTFWKWKMKISKRPADQKQHSAILLIASLGCSGGVQEFQ